MKNYFQEGKNNISYIGSSFKEHFSSMEFKIPKKLKLESKKLERYMTNQKILDEFKPEEVTLGDIVYAVQNPKKVGMLENGYSNLFFVRSKELWVVNVRRSGDGWSFDADPLDYPYRWYGEGQVFSRKSSALGSSDSRDLESRIKELEKFKESVEKLLKLNLKN